MIQIGKTLFVSLEKITFELMNLKLLTVEYIFKSSSVLQHKCFKLKESLCIPAVTVKASCLIMEPNLFMCQTFTESKSRPTEQVTTLSNCNLI